MKKYDYWNSFVNTGRIDDYLHYIACTREESMTDTNAGSQQDTAAHRGGTDLSSRNDDWLDLR